uniref:fimbrial protein n=1 Tax=Klebsiella sp. TaxID=576 RepID=UPI002589EB3F|nr:fimbrial protein [Klebsiella sp.]
MTHTRFKLWSGTFALLVWPGISQAADGTMIFRSTLYAGACMISADTPEVYKGLRNLTIPLPVVSTSSLSSSVQFNIYISCQWTELVNLDNVKVSMTSDATNSDGVLLNTAANGATNVGIQISHDSGARVKVNGPAESSNATPRYRTGTSWNIHGSYLTMKYSASYQKLDPSQAVTPGPVQSVLNYEVIYF